MAIRADQYQQHECKRKLCGDTTNCFHKAIKFPRNFFISMWYTFWKCKQMYPSESENSFIFQDFYFQLPISEYKRGFSLLNFFFGIPKHFPKVFLILKYVFGNHIFPFTKEFLIQKYFYENTLQ